MPTHPMFYEVEKSLHRLIEEVARAPDVDEGIKVALQDALAALTQVPGRPDSHKMTFVQAQVESRLVNARRHLWRTIENRRLDRSFASPEKCKDIEPLPPQEKGLLAEFDQVIRHVQAFAERFSQETDQTT